MSAREREQGCALVTGGSRGIGAAVTERLVTDGWRVATLGRSGGDVRADVGDPQAVAGAFERIEADLGPVLVLVNNAGVREDALTMRLSDSAWETVLATNLSGAFHCTRAALRPMLAARWGRIVNVSSVVAERGNPGQANYAAAKAGMIGMAKSVAAEVATRGITVNCVAPGFIATPMTEALSEEQTARAAAAVPMGRFGNPDEVAAAVVYLASAEAAYVTGATLHVNGGLAMI